MFSGLPLEVAFVGWCKGNLGVVYRRLILLPKYCTSLKREKEMTLPLYNISDFSSIQTFFSVVRN
jgi:hypothetical protein